jgi:hypothetical protein
LAVTALSAGALLLGACEGLSEGDALEAVSLEEESALLESLPQAAVIVSADTTAVAAAILFMVRMC